MPIAIVLAMPTLCYSQNRQLPATNALLVLGESEHGITYLTSVGFNTKCQEVYFLNYSTKSYSKKTKLIEASAGIKLRAIPENSDRFRLETRAVYVAWYENGENAGHGHGISKWSFSCYSDDENCRDAKIFKFFNENRNKFNIEQTVPTHICEEGPIYTSVDQMPVFGTKESFGRDIDTYRQTSFFQQKFKRFVLDGLWWLNLLLMWMALFTMQK